MSLPQSSLLRVSRRAMRQMADRDTPLIRDDGDTVVCGYHGMRYDTRGECVDVPTPETWRPMHPSWPCGGISWPAPGDGS